VNVPRRAIHASCESPWYLSAKHCVSGACFSLTAPFRTRFSPCEMARTADVQKLVGCLYTLRYCYILICRFARHSLPTSSQTRGVLWEKGRETMPTPSLPSPNERGKRWLQAKVQEILAASAVALATPCPERLFEKSFIGGISAVHYGHDCNTIPYRPH